MSGNLMGRMGLMGPMGRSWIGGSCRGCNALVKATTDSLEEYDAAEVTRSIDTFVDDLSNWYVRLSRRRFWKSESDEDKQSAYSTLYEVLVTLTKLLAPIMPFMAEEMYRNLVRLGRPECAGERPPLRLAGRR